MYKSIIIEHRQGGYEIQRGKTSFIDETINKFWSEGYELVSVTSFPYLVDAGRVSFLLVFKKRS